MAHFQICQEILEKDKIKFLSYWPYLVYLDLKKVKNGILSNFLNLMFYIYSCVMIARYKLLLLLI